MRAVFCLLIWVLSMHGEAAELVNCPQKLARSRARKREKLQTVFNATQAELSPENIFKRIQKLGKFRLNIDPEWVAAEWAEYDSNRRIDEPEIPLQKQDDPLYRVLNQIFQNQVPHKQIRVFLTCLKKQALNLVEVTEREIKKHAEAESLFRKGFDIQTFLEQLIQYASIQGPNEPLMPSFQKAPELAKIIKKIFLNKLSSESLSWFLENLSKRHPSLYQEFAFEILHETSAPPPTSFIDNDRWVNTWDGLYYQRFHSMLFPQEAHKPELLSTIRYYLEQATQIETRFFKTSLKLKNPILFYLSEKPTFAVTAPKAQKFFDIQTTVDRWHLHYQFITHKQPLYALTREKTLYKRLMLYRTLSAEEKDIQDFMGKLKHANPILFLSFREAQQEYQEFRSIGLDGTDALGARWAYEWAEYFKTKKPEEPFLPLNWGPYGTLRMWIYKASREKIPPKTIDAFLYTLKKLSPEMVEPAMKAIANPETKESVPVLIPDLSDQVLEHVLKSHNP